MVVEGKTTVINPRGRTKDIIREVLQTYKLYCWSCKDLAETLRRGSEYDTAKAVFDFVLENVQYREDREGVQWIRTPARLLSDGEGDCKSMSILVASLLTNLGIECFFRFVSFSKNKQITHVYVVTESGIIIDVVERVNGQPIFNYASEYTYKQDMNTTQISRLSGIGSTEDIYTPYMAGTYFWANTIADNYLFSELDYIAALLAVEPTMQNYNRLDVVVVAYNLYQRAKGYSELMKRAGCVLQYMQDGGRFEFAGISEDERTQNLGDLVNQSLALLLNNEQLSCDGDLHNWWKEQIASKDYNGLSQDEVNTYNARIGIGASEDRKNALLTNMQESAPYFLYLYLGEEWVRNNQTKYPAIYKKYKIEKALFDSWVVNAAKILDKQTIYNNLRSGFLKRTKQTPEQFIDSVLSGNPKVGLAPVVIAAIVNGVLAIVSIVISGIFDLCGKSMANPDNYPSGVPDDMDVSTEAFRKAGITSGSDLNPNIAKYAFLAVAAFMILNDKN